MSTEDEWRWAEADGSTHPSSESELLEMLRSAQLPAYALVWRTGWGSWLPAHNVAELSSALGSNARLPMPPIRMRGLATPPRVPLSKYAAAGHADGDPILSPAATKPRRSVPPPAPSARASQSTRSTPPPPPSARPPVAPPPPAGAGPSSIPPPPRGPIPIRNVMPTLADRDSVPDRSTLKPARAVAPPPRTPPRDQLPPPPSDAPDGEGHDGIGQPAEQPRSMGPDFVSTLQSAHGQEAAPSPVPPPALPPPPRLPPVAASARPRAGPPPPAAPGRGAGATLPAGLLRTATIVGLSVPVVALLTYLSRGEGVSDEGAPIAAAPAVPSAAAVPSSAPATADPTDATGPEADPAAGQPAAPQACRIERAAHRLSETAFLGVPPIAWPLGGGRVAIGFASNATSSAGITVDLAGGAVERPFSRTTRNPLLGTVPGVVDGKLVFWVDVVGSPLTGLRTVPAEPAFAVGVANGQLVRRDRQGLHPLWPVTDTEGGVTTPRVTSTSDGHVLVTRLGGKSGRIVVGWLTSNGEPKGSLHSVASSDVEVGTPEVTAVGREAVVTFAARPDGESPWRVRMAALQPDAQEATSSVFELPPGGPGGPAIAPATDRLSGDRLLLVWTEGASGSRDVRAQVLDTNLVKLGEPATLSPEGSNAGKGVPFTDGSRALVVFYVKAESSDELWGATLKCD